ncbi:MAG: hypothetical protein J7647_15150 [Cyanobacteria bacterium SBLK]|nr:hypothetical protein [Cyanobacteria bacterium SBLK]
MQIKKPPKIDLNDEYPCPCRRRGTLKPILLTDAFGCDRCQQIFVVEESGRTIEQLSTTYPYKRSWRWTGHRWIAARTPLRENYIPVLGISILLILMGGLLILQSRFPHIFLPILVVLLAIVPAFAIWLSYRR